MIQADLVGHTGGEVAEEMGLNMSSSWNMKNMNLPGKSLLLAMLVAATFAIAQEEEKPVPKGKKAMEEQLEVLKHLTLSNVEDKDRLQKAVAHLVKSLDEERILKFKGNDRLLTDDFFNTSLKGVYFPV